jgi:tight adherence protein C
MSPASAPGATGALGGLVLGLGLWLVLVRLPPLRRPSLDDRLAPYLREAAPGSRLLLRADGARGPLRAVEALLGPALHDASRWAGRGLAAVSGGPASVRRRLQQAGSAATVEQFRAEQVLSGVAGSAAGLLLAVVLAARGGASWVPGLGLVGVGGLAGVLARDRALSRAVHRREERMLAEFPTVAELLALSVSAGEGAVGALERVAGTSRGELAGELRRTLADARAGASLVQALEGLAGRTSLASLARFVDGVAVAVERGTPLADVLRAQAQDVRQLGRRRLVEAGGRKEIAMMVPVVFLVLPITVLFAVYPGLAVLRLGP